MRAALVALGVVVAAQAVASGTDDTAAELAERALECDTVVVVLSPALFARRWPKDVLEDMLTPVAGASHAAPPLLPVWHRITRPEVLAASEQLEKTLAFDTGTKGLDAIAQGIADIVRPDLASGALHKAIWASTLQGRVLGEGRTEFQLPIRHAALDDELLARIRVLRAAFIDGGRQTLPAWVDAFRREMEPLTAITEWERLARAFHEIRWLQRHLGADAATQTAALAALVPDDVESALRERMRAAYLELVRVPPERLFKMVWALSQTVASVVDLGFSAGVLAIASHVLEAERPPIEATDSFDPGPSGIDLEIESFDVSGEDWSEGVLHHEEERPWSKPWDVFVSHASEDKASLVRPLAEALQEYGVKVWYDNFTLRPGCSLGRSIDAGIDEAEFGIVVLSPSFVAKEWPRYEFDALRHRHTERGERLITLWHGLRVDDAPPWAQGLDGVQGLDSSAQSTTELAMNILKRVRPDLARHVQRRLEHRAALERQRIGQTPTQRVQFG
ncbi:MAG: toll/interleukin-1 receptor domain-containing protein, partial [Rubrivivax sp.]|nr:toll/interleukin-1 receptor domain-containing protein [Rubrivivax sp.]